MKHLFLAALIALAPIGACSTIQGAALSTTSTSIVQASTVKAAGDLYMLATHAATAYLQSGKASKETARQMADVEGQVYAALIAARQADKRGDSPAAGAALALFNKNYAALSKLVPGL